MSKNLEKLQSMPSPLRSAGVSESGNMLFKGLGIVFGGRDVYGNFFSPPQELMSENDPDVKIGTDYFFRELADEVDPETKELRGALAVPVFWDHGVGSLGTKRLGQAVPIRITDEGIEYLIEIERKRAKEYQQMIEELQNEGWLGLSSQTLSSFASFDWMSGEIKAWFPAEMTLTVTPAEHRTRDGMEKVRSLFRKYGVKSMEEQQTELIPAEEETISNVVDELFNDLNSELTEEQKLVMESEALSIVVRSLSDVSARLTAIEARLNDTATLSHIQAVQAEVAKSRDQFADAMKTFTKRMAEVLVPAVRTSAATMVQQASETELQALRGMDQSGAAPAATTKRSMYKLPPNAPGQN